jgi:hypothetical protein
MKVQHSSRVLSSFQAFWPTIRLEFSGEMNPFYRRNRIRLSFISGFELVRWSVVFHVVSIPIIE